MKVDLLIVAVAVVGLVLWKRHRDGAATPAGPFSGGVAQTSGGGAAAMQSTGVSTASQPQLDTVTGMEPARATIMPVTRTSPDAAAGTTYGSFHPLEF